MGRIFFQGALLALVTLGAFALRGHREALRVPETPVTVPAAVAQLGEEGGALAHEGARLTVPRGALHAKAELAIKRTPLPAPLAKGYRAVSPIVRLRKTEPGRFAKPVTITLPVDETPLERTVALYWDEEHELYRTLTITGRDEKARTVSFETVHFTDFLVAGPDGTLPPLPDVDTGFRPEKDGFFFQNGDYDSNGTCLGMSLLSTWYFETHRKQPDAPSLHALLESFHPLADQADLVGREMALAAQHAAVPDGEYLAKASKVALDEAKRVGPVASGVALIEALQATGTPQLLVLEGPGGAHAVVAYAYKNGWFDVYDPNFPLVKQSLKFDRQDGFTTWTGTHLGEPLTIAPVSFSSYASDVDFAKIFAKALADKGTPERYQTVTVDGTASDGETLTIRGHVSGGLANPSDPATLVTIVSGHQPFGDTTLELDGTFTLRVSWKWLDIVVGDTHAAPAIVLGAPWGFAGATAVTLPTPPSKTPGVVSALPDH